MQSEKKIDGKSTHAEAVHAYMDAVKNFEDIGLKLELQENKKEESRGWPDSWHPAMMMYGLPPSMRRARINSSMVFKIYSKNTGSSDVFYFETMQEVLAFGEAIKAVRSRYFSLVGFVVKSETYDKEDKDRLQNAQEELNKLRSEKVNGERTIADLRKQLATKRKIPRISNATGKPEVGSNPT